MGERVTRIQWFGLVLGLLGVVLVMHDREIILTGSLLGWIASFLSLIGITLGTLYQKRYCGRSTGALVTSCNISAQPRCFPSALLRLKRAKFTGAAN
jgi:drug/metabolite transporter (DMT)-like permease